MLKFYIGADIGGTKIYTEAADGLGNILLSEKIPTIKNINELAKYIKNFAGRIEGELIGIGIGVPGNVDKNGVVIDAPALGWHNEKVKEAILKEINAPVNIENDVNTALIGECEYGHGKNTDNILFISVGTGLGSAYKIDGNLCHGMMGMCGEVGYILDKEDAMSIVTGKEKVSASLYGALESKASGSALDKYAKEIGTTNPEMFKNYSTDSRAKRIIDNFIFTLSYNIANLVTILAPELVVIGGGVADDLLNFKNEITASVNSFSPLKVNIEFSKMGNRAGVMGAVALAKKG